MHLSNKPSWTTAYQWLWMKRHSPPERTVKARTTFTTRIYFPRLFHCNTLQNSVVTLRIQWIKLRKNKPRHWQRRPGLGKRIWLRWTKWTCGHISNKVDRACLQGMWLKWILRTCGYRFNKLDSLSTRIKLNTNIQMKHTHILLILKHVKAKSTLKIFAIKNETNNELMSLFHFVML